MSNGEHDDPVRLDDVNQSVGEARQSEAAHAVA